MAVRARCRRAVPDVIHAEHVRCVNDNVALGWGFVGRMAPVGNILLGVLLVGLVLIGSLYAAGALSSSRSSPSPSGGGSSGGSGSSPPTPPPSPHPVKACTGSQMIPPPMCKSLHKSSQFSITLSGSPFSKSTGTTTHTPLPVIGSPLKNKWKTDPLDPLAFSPFLKATNQDGHFDWKQYPCGARVVNAFEKPIADYGASDGARTFRVWMGQPPSTQANNALAVSDHGSPFMRWVRRLQKSPFRNAVVSADSLGGFSWSPTSSDVTLSSGTATPSALRLSVLNPNIGSNMSSHAGGTGAAAKPSSQQKAQPVLTQEVAKWKDPMVCNKKRPAAPGNTGSRCYLQAGAPIAGLKLKASLTKWPSGVADSSYSGFDFRPEHGLRGEFGGMIGAGMNTKGWIVPGSNDWHADDGGLVHIGTDSDTGESALNLDTYAKWDPSAQKWGYRVGGGIMSSKKMASGRYDVVAKVPDSPGLVFAIWTFCGNWKVPSGRTGCKKGKTVDCRRCVECGGQSSDGASWCKQGQRKGDKTCNGVDCNAAKKHVEFDTENTADITFLRDSDSKVTMPDGSTAHANAALGGMPFFQDVNHEIDIELPSNAPQLTQQPDGSNQQQRCGSIRNNTMNCNTYRITNGAGTGSYVNLLAVKGEDGNPADKRNWFYGDGKYHKYTIEWHTGDPSKSQPAVVHWYVDDDYICSSDAFVPTAASRLWIGAWHSSNQRWAGPIKQEPAPKKGEPDEQLYQRISVKRVSVALYHESNDMYMPEVLDQPDMRFVTPGKAATGCCRLSTQAKHGLPSKEVSTYGRCVAFKWHSDPNACEGKDGECAEESSTPPRPQTFVPFYSLPVKEAKKLEGEQPGVVYDVRQSSPHLL